MHPVVANLRSVLPLLAISILLSWQPPTALAGKPVPVNDDTAKTRLADSIKKLLGEVDEQLGGGNTRIALIGKKLDELLVLSLEQTHYNDEASEGRAGRECEEFDYDAAYDECADLTDGALERRLHDLVDNHHDLGYREARKALFTDIDNFDGTIECVYTGRQMQNITSIPNANNMNTEHTWPQSQGATGTAKSDIHHLFITDSKANSVRGSYPFGWVTNPDWEQGGSCRGGKKFQPRPCHRGNVARAIFYFAIRYNKRVHASQEAALRQWHKDDPVDEAERNRNDAVFKYQRNRNPFVDRPNFVEQISDF